MWSYIYQSVQDFVKFFVTVGPKMLDLPGILHKIVSQNRKILKGLISCCSIHFRRNLILRKALIPIYASTPFPMKWPCWSYTLFATLCPTSVTSRVMTHVLISQCKLTITWPPFAFQSIPVFSHLISFNQPSRSERPLQSKRSSCMSWKQLIK